MEIKLTGDLDKSLKQYIRLIAPIIKLENKNKYCNILALLIKYYLKYEKDIADKDLRWRMVFHYDTMIAICNELGIKYNTYHSSLSNLRKRGLIKNNQVVPHLIPKINNNTFTLNFIFNVSDTTQGQNQANS